MKQGDIIYKGEDRRKIFGICGEVVFISEVNSFETMAFGFFSVKKLINEGWKVLEEECVPENNNITLLNTIELWFLRLHNEPNEWTVEDALKEIKDKLNIK